MTVEEHVRMVEELLGRCDGPGGPRSMNPPQWQVEQAKIHAMAALALAMAQAT